MFDHFFGYYQQKTIYFKMLVFCWVLKRKYPGVFEGMFSCTHFYVRKREYTNSC